MTIALEIYLPQDKNGSNLAYGDPGDNCGAEIYEVWYNFAQNKETSVNSHILSW